MIDSLEKVVPGMPLPITVDKTSPVYDYMLPEWTKNRDCVAGQKAIKERGTTYLPKPNGHSTEQYNKYLQRAQWFNATGRTVEGLTGMLFRKPPVVTTMNKDGTPEQINDENTSKLIRKAFKHLSTDGKGLNATIRDFTDEVIKVNRVGALVDYPYTDEDLANMGVQSRLDEEELVLYPQVAMYKTESIINWDWEVTPTGVVPVMFVLKEQIQAYNDSTLVADDIYQYRILYLEGVNDPTKERRYKQIITTKATDTNEYGEEITYDEVKSVVYPKNNGEYIPYIPFYILTDKGIDYRNIEPSMINDLCDVNLGHYQNSADWENELHWVGIKTAIFPGWDKNVHGDPYIGTALAAPADSKPYIMEAKSDSGIKDEMAVKREQMAVLGAERLSQKGRYVASASTSKINSSSDSATLSTTATVLSEAFTEILNMLLEWAGEEKRINIKINTDFYQDDLDGEELLKWIEALQQGGISYDVFYYNLTKKEAFPPEWNEEREKEALRETMSGGLGDGTFDEVVAELNMLKRSLADVTGQEFVQPKKETNATTSGASSENTE